MPYNNSTLPSGPEPTGTTQLPFSRVKKIIATDQDIQIMSNAGAFIISVATEMFIQHLAEQAHRVAKSERKPRRHVQYRDLAMAVSNHDNLEFLIDIVPTTLTYKKFKENKTKSGSHKPNGVASATEAGQTTLEVTKSTHNGHKTSGEMSEDSEDMDAVDNAQINDEFNTRQTRISCDALRPHDTPNESIDDINSL